MLHGKAVVVTGAGRGLGAAYARDAAAHGALVVVNDIDFAAATDVAGDIADTGGRAVPHGGDLTSWGVAKELVGLCVEEYGRIDGLVNNAGVIYVSPPEDQDEAELRRLVEVNVLAGLFVGTHAIEAMLGQGGGAIVNVTSGSTAGTTRLGAYGATKAAAASLTFSWALDLGPRGIRVNCIAPMAGTRMFDPSLLPDGPDSPAAKPPAPEENAPVVTFLLSDAAEGIEGQIVRIDSGTLSLMSHPSVVEPVITRERWTAADVADAFDDRLRAHLVPLGLSRPTG